MTSPLNSVNLFLKSNQSSVLHGLKLMTHCGASFNKHKLSIFMKKIIFVMPNVTFVMWPSRIYGCYLQTKSAAALPSIQLSGRTWCGGFVQQVKIQSDHQLRDNAHLCKRKADLWQNIWLARRVHTAEMGIFSQATFFSQNIRAVIQWEVVWTQVKGKSEAGCIVWNFHHRPPLSRVSRLQCCWI